MNSIDHEPLFTDLMPEQAAATQGGYDDLCVYKDFGFRNLLGCFKSSASKLPPSIDNQISSLIVRKGVWDFYDLPYFNYFKTRDLTVTPGWWSYLGSFDNRISSFKRRPGT